MTGAAPAPQRAGRREWLGLAVLALPCVVYAMDLTVLNLALPAMSADLRPTATELLWIVDIYGFLVAGALITMGSLGDRIGGRRLLMIGAAVFAFASILAALATSPAMLIASRALLGLAGATLAPSTLSLIRALFADPRQRTVAIGVWVTSYSAGAAIGPLAGGALLELFWWGSVLLLGVPVMLLLLIVGPRLLPEQRDPQGSRLDLVSAAMSLGAVLAAVYGLKHAATNGLDADSSAWIAAGLALGALFVRRQRLLASPLIDLRLFRSRAYSGALAANLAVFFVVFGMSLFLAQYLQAVLGLSPIAAGCWSLPPAFGFIIGSTLAPKLVGRWPSRYLIATGLGGAALGYLLLGIDGSSLAQTVVGATIAAIGGGAVVTLVTDVALSVSPPERAGAASATAETSAELGGALGIAVLGAIGGAIYRSSVADSLPDAAPQTARETVGGAVAAGEELPGQVGERVADAARGAFEQALTVTASVSAALLALSAVAVAMLLRTGRLRLPGQRAVPSAAVRPVPALAPSSAGTAATGSCSKQ